MASRAGASFPQYWGSGTEATSFVNYGNYGNYSNGANYERGYTNSLHGSRLGKGYILSGRVQRVGCHQGLLAFDLGDDWARSSMASPALLLG